MRIASSTYSFSVRKEGLDHEYMLQDVQNSAFGGRHLQHLYCQQASKRL